MRDYQETGKNTKFIKPKSLTTKPKNVYHPNQLSTRCILVRFNS